MSDPAVDNNQPRLFLSKAEMMGYVFKSGKLVHFMQHRYITSDSDEIKELETEIKKGHSNYYVDSNAVYATPEMDDPLSGLKQRIREEERQKLIAEMGEKRDMGSYETGGQLKGIANSNSIRGLSVNSGTDQQTTGAVQVGTIKVGSGVVAARVG